jgi:hypothetical protein
MARQALADPDWFRKVKCGRGDEVRRCTYTNYCEALDQAHRQVTCKLWDRKELDEEGIAMASDGRRRLLPPSGMNNPQITQMTQIGWKGQYHLRKQVGSRTQGGIYDPSADADGTDFIA